MNKRTRELWLQAWTAADEVVDLQGKVYFDIVVEKFAELIVRECADAADMAQDAGCKFAGDYVAEQMGYGQEKGVTEWRTRS
jgi:hypothetical protein